MLAHEFERPRVLIGWLLSLLIALLSLTMASCSRSHRPTEAKPSPEAGSRKYISKMESVDIALKELAKTGVNLADYKMSDVDSIGSKWIVSFELTYLGRPVIGGGYEVVVDKNTGEFWCEATD